jgi:hypothetical protein
MVDAKIFIIGLIIAAIGIAVTLAQARVKNKMQAGSFQARKLMTDNEAEFLGRLIAALPDHYVFPQVAMSALIEPSSRDKKQAHGDRLRIAQQRVDFVVCDKQCKVVAVVELDDSTHSRAKDQTRDARLLQGGVRTVRFESKNKPDLAALSAAIVPAPSSP